MSWESYFLKQKTFFRVSVSWNIKKIFRVSVSWSIRNSLMLEPESSISQNIRKYKRIKSGLFLFFELGKFLPEIQESSNVKNEINFLILKVESSISWNIRNFFGMDFFYFFELGLKSTLGSCIYYYLKFLKNIWKKSGMGSNFSAF